MNDAIKQVQKAVVGFLVPLALYGLAEFTEWAGPDIPRIDPSIVETLVGSLVSAFFVWLVPNLPKSNNTPEA